MQITKRSNPNLAVRQAVKETIFLGGILLVAVFLFVVSIHFIANKEATHDLENRPWGLMFGWFTAIAIGLVLGKTRREESGQLPKSLIIVRESLQLIMLLLFFGVLCYASYFLYTSRALILQRPWGILIGWFAFLIFTACFAKTRHLVRSAKQKEESIEG